MNIRTYVARGDIWIWLTAGAVSISALMVFSLLMVIGWRGLNHFWPKQLVAAVYAPYDGEEKHVLGEIHGKNMLTIERLHDAQMLAPDEGADYERWQDSKDGYEQWLEQGAFADWLLHVGADTVQNIAAYQSWKESAQALASQDSEDHVKDLRAWHQRELQQLQSDAGFSHWFNAEGRDVYTIWLEQEAREVWLNSYAFSGWLKSKAYARWLEHKSSGTYEQWLIKAGNRDHQASDFLYVMRGYLRDQAQPRQALTFERMEWGNLYGYAQAVYQGETLIAQGSEVWSELKQRLGRAEQLRSQIEHLKKRKIGDVNHAIEQLRVRERRLELHGGDTPERIKAIGDEKRKLEARFEELRLDLNRLYEALARDRVVVRLADGQEVEQVIGEIVRVLRPNNMNLAQQLAFMGAKMWEFVSDEPREANTEGGIFPALFGTVMMVMIMSILVTPFGVVAAVYLREYAKQGWLTQMIRIAVNNLAGVPSIVYGVFGLGFFVYFLGGSLDEIFFAAKLPHPTFGTPGIMWASLTLAILTLPVVIVSTEEGLTRIPREIREGSLALGATKAETLLRIILPMSSPSILTGLILAIARAAGEVAPLMLVGVVKLAPSLPLDHHAPFVHLDRKFMHLGFHIFDVGFQSPNVESARPLVYATAFLLVLVIVMLNLSAVMIRNRLRERYRALGG